MKLVHIWIQIINRPNWTYRDKVHIYRNDKLNRNNLFKYIHSIVIVYVIWWHDTMRNSVKHGTLWAEKKTYGDSNLDSSTLAEWCKGNSVEPFEKCGGEEVGNDEAGEKANGWGVAGDVQKGTAAGLTGEEKMGGPGGVLNRGIGLLACTPSPDDSELGVLDTDFGSWSCWGLWGENLVGTGEENVGAASLCSGRVPGEERVTGNPTGGGGEGFSIYWYELLHNINQLICGAKSLTSLFT